MIQRIQTVYLLMVCIFSFLLFFTPVLQYGTGLQKSILNAGKQNNIKYTLLGFIDVSGASDQRIESTYIPPLTNGLVVLLSVAAIMTFKKRRLQMRLCKLTIVLNCLLLALFCFYIQKKAVELTHIATGSIQYLIGIYLPVASIIFLYLALLAIKKDENLVRSADRLR